MLHNIFLTIIFSLIASFASSIPTQFFQKGNGFTAPLISPISPHSPFYPEVLAANNIPATSTNVTLDRTHYEKWVEAKRNNISQDHFSVVKYNKNAAYYVIGLFLGNPMQMVYGIFDTGSELIWVQCKSQAGKNKFPYFNQTRSPKYKVLDCRDNLCRMSYSQFLTCGLTSRGDVRCAYQIQYVDGTASRGLMASDIVTMEPAKTVVPNFVFGCSFENPNHTPGIIGAGNSIFSMPRQLYPRDARFSYCISGLSDKINYVRFGPDATLIGRRVKIFRHHLDPFYYMDVVGMQVNGAALKVDPSVFALSSDGETGFIIDSGYEYTSLSGVAYDVLKQTMYDILGTPRKISFFEMCYQFGSHWLSKSRPTIGIAFRDFVFTLDDSNVWRKMGSTGYTCLLVYRSSKVKLSVLGAEQLFDVNIGHDVKNNFLYINPMKCPTVP